MFVKRRDEYLEMCRKCAMIPERGMWGIPAVVPPHLRVIYKEKAYFPFAYQLSFSRNGKIRHTAILHELKRNAIVNADLRLVEPYMPESEK